MLFGEKLKNLIKTKYRTVGECAEKLEINYSQLSQYLNGRSISQEHLSKIINDFPNTDLNWLLRDDFIEQNTINESPVLYKRLRNNTEIINKIETLLGDLKEQLPQK